MNGSGNERDKQESKQRRDKPPEQQGRTQNEESGWGEDAIHC